MVGKVMLTATTVILLPFVIYFFGVSIGMGKVFRVPTGAMQPTINSGDHVFAVRYRPSAGDLTRGELVVFDAEGLREPRGMKLSGIWVKRIAGLPGDTITQKDGLILVNGSTVTRNGSQALAPPTYNRGKGMPVFPLVVPANQVFLLGDNFHNSLDSRYFGPVAIDRLKYRPIHRLFPTSKAGKLK